MTKPSSAGKITIPASTRRLRSASHHEDVALEAGDLGEDANTTEDTAADAPEDTEGPSLGARRTAPEHHYNTRVTNDPHPARTARLARRNHAEVQEDLAAELRRKQAELAAQKDEYQRHIDELAELEESIKSREIEESMENILEKESLMILADEAAFKAAAVEVGLDGGKHLHLAEYKAHPGLLIGHIDDEDDIEMQTTVSDRSKLSESEVDIHPGEKRKAGKQKAKVCVRSCAPCSMPTSRTEPAKAEENSEREPQ